jgi:hypothetical protein
MNLVYKETSHDFLQGFQFGDLYKKEIEDDFKQ